MVVFTGAYNCAFDGLEGPGPMILDKDSYSELLKDKQLYFMGDGAPKFKELISSPNAHWMDGLEPLAKDMIALSEKAFREKDFIDIAYSVPEYLKEYQTTVAKPKI